MSSWSFLSCFCDSIFLARQVWGAAGLQQFPHKDWARALEHCPLSPHSPQHCGPVAGGILPLGHSGELLAGWPGRQSAQALQRLGAARQHQRHEGETVQDAGPRLRGLPAGGPSQDRWCLLGVGEVVSWGEWVCSNLEQPAACLFPPSNFSSSLHLSLYPFSFLFSTFFFSFFIPLPADMLIIESLRWKDKYKT